MVDSPPLGTMTARTLTLPFRALRFAGHLVAIGHARFLAREVLSEAYSLACWPKYRACCRRYGYAWHEEIAIQSEHRLSTGPDAKSPWGACHNWKTNYGFALAMMETHGISHFKFGRLLDLGCSTGRLVQTFHRLGWIAVGLEGSDYPARYAIGAWDGLRGVRLFCCDIGQPFTIHAAHYPERFNVITAWDVFEHLTQPELVNVCANIERHSDEGTELFLTMDNSSEKPQGIELHQTRWDYETWARFLCDHLPSFQLRPPLPFYQNVRRSARGLNFRMRCVRTKPNL